MAGRIIGRPREVTHLVDDETGCWNWQGGLNNKGYGQHRRTYEDLVGPVPESMTLDHLCRNRACVNPAHLEPVTLRENLRRAGIVDTTHCSEGHERTEVNTYHRNGNQYCRPCRARAARDFRARRAA